MKRKKNTVFGLSSNLASDQVHYSGGDNGQNRKSESMNPTQSPQHSAQPPLYEEVSMHPEFQTAQPRMDMTQMEQMFHAISNMLLQVNNTNQTLLGFISSQGTTPNRTDTKVRPKPFSGLPSEDVLSWLDHFENIASYHQWSEERKALEVRTLFENVAATWFIQQQEDTKRNWSALKSILIQNFAHQNMTQTALQQLQVLKQQLSEPVAQFAVKLNQLLLRADPTMSEEMKLFFLWPRLRHDISRRVRDQGPTSLHDAIQIAQRVESATTVENLTIPATQPSVQRQPIESMPVPMDIDIQNAQYSARRALPTRDTRGRPKCFYCNNYGHIKRDCRKLKSQQHYQNSQIVLADAASLAELSGNE